MSCLKAGRTSRDALAEAWWQTHSLIKEAYTGVEKFRRGLKHFNILGAERFLVHVNQRVTVKNMTVMDCIMTKDTGFPCFVVGVFCLDFFSYVLILFQVQSYNQSRKHFKKPPLYLSFGNWRENGIALGCVWVIRLFIV